MSFLMSDAPRSPGDSAPDNPQFHVNSLVEKYQSSMFCALDALSRANDHLFNGDGLFTNLLYVHDQLDRAISKLENCCMFVGKLHEFKEDEEVDTPLVTNGDNCDAAVDAAFKAAGRGIQL